MERVAAPGLAPRMHVPHDVDRVTCSPSPVRVGRLTPLVGVEPREHPDRAQVRQLLREMQLPLAAVQAMLELAVDAPLPEPTQLALRAAQNHTDYVLDLVADFVELDRLQADAVAPKPEAVDST